MPRSKRVLIGSPAFNGIIPECQENFFGLAFRLGRDHPEYEFMVKIINKKEQFRARNNLIDMAKANDCDYLLMLDDDMQVPTDLFARLVKHDKDVIGALYFQRGGAYHPIVLFDDVKDSGEVGIKFINAFDDMLLKRGLYQVDIIGGGCMLFKMHVFDKMRKPYFWWEAEEGTDVAICRELRRQGFSIWVDTSIELDHYGDKQAINSQTIPQYNAEIGVIRESLFNDLQDYTGMPKEALHSDMTIGMQSATRTKMWGNRDPEKWEDVKSYYQDNADWHIVSLTGFMLTNDLKARRYALTELDRHLQPGSVILDYGCGVGACSIALAQKGYHMIALDVEGAGTLQFVRWRINRHKLQDMVRIEELATPYPMKALGETIDGALMTSVLDHLPNPYETLEFIIKHLRNQGLLICDWMHVKLEGEHQHLMKYEAQTFDRWMKEHGMICRPDKPWLFIKES